MLHLLCRIVLWLLFDPRVFSISWAGQEEGSKNLEGPTKNRKDQNKK